MWFIPIYPIFKTEWFLWRRPLLVIFIHKIYVFVLIIRIFTCNHLRTYSEILPFITRTRQ